MPIYPPPSFPWVPASLRKGESSWPSARGPICCRGARVCLPQTDRPVLRTRGICLAIGGIPQASHGAVVPLFHRENNEGREIRRNGFEKQRHSKRDQSNTSEGYRRSSNDLHYRFLFTTRSNYTRGYYSNIRVVLDGTAAEIRSP